MQEQDGLSLSKFRQLIDILTPTMDDYLYIYDMPGDQYCISSNAMERFPLEKNCFDHVVEELEKLVYPPDFPGLNEEIEQIQRKEKKFHNMQYRWVNKAGEAIWINCRGSVLPDAQGNPKLLVGCINEIGVSQKADNITGLLGETSLQGEFKAREGEALSGFFLRIGIDNFKEINENRGMEYGNMILKRTAECIGHVLRPGQMLYRIVADEFAVLDFSARDMQEAVTLYGEIRDEINRFIEESCYDTFFTISAGALDFQKIGNPSYNNIMKLAEFSLNEAKNGGKNKIYLYEQADYEAFQRRRSLLKILRWSVNHDYEGFSAYFQPITDLDKKRFVSAETLLRFSSKETGPVSPAEFIPLLEESGLIIPVGRFVMHRAMEACSRIRKYVPNFWVTINVSYVQVLKSDVLKELLEGEQMYGLQPGAIVVELTESGFLGANEKFISFCDGLQKHGIPLALDDFGTGYSNFHYLYNVKPSTIKIDRSFTVKALQNNYEYDLLRYMVDMTHSISLKLCIEGIETQDELNRIRGINPDYIQGYFFGRPCDFNSFWREFIEPLKQTETEAEPEPEPQGVGAEE